MGQIMRNLFILVVVVTVIVVAKLLIKNVDYSQSVKYVENHFNLYDNNNKSTDIVNSSYVVNNTTPLVLKEKADESVAEVLKQRVRVLIWVMTSPKNLHKARAVKNTWGSRCDLLLFFSSENNTELPTIELDVEEGREHLYEKTTQAFDYIYENYFDMADWFMKVDDDTFVIVENLRHFLHDKNASEPVYTGRHFIEPKLKINFQSGGAGYVLSKEALRRFATRELSPPVCTNHTTYEDVEMARCLLRLNVTILNSTDDKLRTRFHPFNMERHLANGPPKGRLKYEANPVKLGIDGINEHAISFHYITPEQMFSFYYFLYHCRPFGLSYSYDWSEHPQT
ncbi:glycoprotein-N-acetylgalactosamine 3-beta-galactosyltransferase 1-like isoform X1 [Pomacea canaliculata]|uniref:glycoprotein-N-acetylgalactosamine 3-beta-galactosyltransferase 1-like isoform X1 n=1 Tax=Pomacea canaliculata TaxID=400727 RepID=UPI000D73B4A7|nr:glycoprotein-N-acetylgalactosamine 3-beta-galactosyltransferase 1-like isoform X1 [Pomacea canaliculata]XP_025089370.1 glycoprotein-N-acetylgalactosamine 3-beta-galactosyltransferase 1-like isoform X1 [Pomacea canaliculata]